MQISPPPSKAPRVGVMEASTEVSGIVCDDGRDGVEESKKKKHYSDRLAHVKGDAAIL